VTPGLRCHSRSTPRLTRGAERRSREVQAWKHSEAGRQRLEHFLAEGAGMARRRWCLRRHKNAREQR